MPGEYPTLQEALDAAAEGDTVLLAAGDFTGGALPRPLTLRGAGMGRTVVHGEITINGFGEVTISDLTVVGEGGGTGIGGESAGYAVERCEVRSFRWGIGVYGSRGALTITGNLVAGNQYGIDLGEAGGLIANNVVIHNTHGGIVARAFADMDIRHNTVVGNAFSGSPDSGSGAIVMGPFGRNNVVNNILVGNGYGLSCLRCSGRYDHNLIWGNREDHVGGAGIRRGDRRRDPRFVAPAEGDFRLLHDSPAIDAGADLGVATDFDGRARPFGEAPDMGAFEWGQALPGLVLNEVMANQEDEGTGEYVEIHNGSDAPVDVAGFVLDDGDSPDVVEARAGGPTTIPAGGYGVVLDRDYAGGYEIPGEAVQLTVGDSRLGNSLAVGDPVSLLLDDGVTVLSTYSQPFNPGNGVSAERTAPDAPDDEASWVPSPCGATPGRVNCTVEPPAEPEVVALLITEVMANPLDEGTGEFVEVLNRGNAPFDLSGLELADGDDTDLLVAFGAGGAVVDPGAYAVIVDRDYDDDYEIPPGTVLLTVEDARLGNALATSDPVTLRRADGELLAAFSHPSNPGNGRSLELVDLDRGNVAGNWVAATCEAGASPGRPNCASAGGVDPARFTFVINEVMANPLDEDTGEFVELLNSGAEPLDAAGLVLDDGDASDVLIGLDGGPTVVAPGALAVVLDPEYAGEYPLPEGLVLLRPGDTTLGSGLAVRDPVTLRAPDGVMVVSTFSFPFNPGNGRSAERVDDRGDVEGNWVASPCAGGSSPGRRNCAAGRGEDPPPDEADVPALVINEVMANPEAESRDEFIEVLNADDHPVDVAGFVVFDGDAPDPIEGFDGGPTVIPAGGYGLILDRDYVGAYAFGDGAVLLTVDDRTIASGLAVSDPITILLPDGSTVVDAFAGPFDPGNGRSVERVDPAAADVPTNWVAATCEGEQRSSPGGPNCAAGGGGLDPEGQLVDVNAAAAAELERLDGIGPALAGRIVAYRAAHGGFEDLRQLVAIEGISLDSVAGWERLAADEDFYLGLSPDDARPTTVLADIAALRGALPDPAAPGDWEGRVVRLERAVVVTADDDGARRAFDLRDWGSAAAFEPNGAAAIGLYLEAADRNASSLLDGLADWEKEHGPPNTTVNLYRDLARLPAGGRLRVNHVYAVQAVLQVYQGDWQLSLRPDAAPGMDRVVLVERWLAAELWRELVVVWSYNFEPALVRAEGFSTTLPYRLVLAHPLVAFWQELTGHAPALSRQVDADDPVDYGEYNDALAAWLVRPCDVDFVEVANDDVADYNRLLEIATTMDGPYAQVHSVRAVGCEDYFGRDADRRALAMALWSLAFPYRDDELGGIPRDVRDFVGGGGAYLTELGRTRTAIVELTEDGHWDPENDAEGAALYGRLDELVAALRAPVDADPAPFLSTWMVLDASECSEHGGVLVDTRDNTILIVHRLPWC